MEHSRRLLLLVPILYFGMGCQTSAASLEDEISLSGQWVQGGLIKGVAPENARITYNGDTVLQSDSGHFVIGFGRDEKGPAKLEIQVQDQVWAKTFPVEQRGYKVQKIEGIAKKIMKPSPQNQARASKEAVMVREARKTKRMAVDFLMGFQWPAQGPITGVYGSQRVYNGVPGRPHYGIDIAGPTGAPVRAPAPGVVTLAHDDMFYSGGTLIVDHGLGLSSTMIHLSKILVEEGQSVNAGDIIAEIGSSGRSTGPHLDWRLNWFQRRLDPLLQVPAR